LKKARRGIIASAILLAGEREVDHALKVGLRFGAAGIND
jgi:hypothetical protein